MMNDAAAFEERVPDAAGAVRVVLLVVAGALLLLEVLAAGPLRGQLWGFHLTAFVPSWVTAIRWSLLLAGACWLAGLPGRHRSGTGAQGLEQAAGRLAGWFERHPRLVTGAVTLTAAALFVALRSRQDLLGDAVPLVTGLPEGDDLHPRAPLALLIQSGVYRGLASIKTAGGEEVARTSVALVSVACGVLFVWVAMALGRVITGSSAATRSDHPADPLAALLVAMILVSQGFAVLFFGYLENYALLALGVGVYLLVALLHLGGRLPLAVPIVVLLVVTGVHLAAVVLVPSLLFLVIRALRRPPRARAWRDLAIGFVVLLLLDRALAGLESGYSLGRAVADMVRGTRTGVGAGYWLSPVHLRDFLNEQHLIGPLGAWLFVPGLVLLVRRRRATIFHDPGLVFLALAAATYLGASWWMPEPILGYARDWDAFAPAGVAYTTAGLLLLVRGVRPGVRRQRLLLFAWLVSMLHLVPWVLVNQSEARSLARFEQLPLGRGRTEVTVGNWHLRHGDPGEAERWFDRALAIDPRNVNAHRLLAEVYRSRDEHRRVVQAFERALAVRPDKLEYRAGLARALVDAGRSTEALSHLEAVLAIESDRYTHWMNYGEALHRAGRVAESRQAIERALALCEARLARRPQSYRLLFDSATLLARLDDKEGALARYEAALARNPGSPAVLYNVGVVLRAMGRDAEARERFTRLLKTFPDHPRRALIGEWLAAGTDTTGDQGENR